MKALAPEVQRALLEASEKTSGDISPEMVTELVDDLSKKAEESVRESIDPIVENAKKTVVAASTGESQAAAG